MGRGGFECGDDDERRAWVGDKRGNESFVPAAKIAYVELGSPDDTRRIGFGN